MWSVDTLPYLFHASFVLDEGLAPLILRLLHMALAGVAPPKTPPISTSEGKEGILRRQSKKDKDQTKEKETKQQGGPRCFKASEFALKCHGLPPCAMYHVMYMCVFIQYYIYHAV